jgi:hypothetical protein
MNVQRYKVTNGRLRKSDGTRWENWIEVVLAYDYDALKARVAELQEIFRVIEVARFAWVNCCDCCCQECKNFDKLLRQCITHNTLETGADDANKMG